MPTAKVKPISTLWPLPTLLNCLKLFGHAALHYDHIRTVAESQHFICWVTIAKESPLFRLLHCPFTNCARHAFMQNLNVNSTWQRMMKSDETFHSWARAVEPLSWIGWPHDGGCLVSEVISWFLGSPSADSDSIWKEIGLPDKSVSESNLLPHLGS